MSKAAPKATIEELRATYLAAMDATLCAMEALPGDGAHSYRLREREAATNLIVALSVENAALKKLARLRPNPRANRPEAPMPDLRWQPGDVGCTDLVDGDGRLRGYVRPVKAGVRGYVIEAGPQFAAIEDRPTPEAARAWVESEVRGLGETSGGGPDGR